MKLVQGINTKLSIVIIAIGSFLAGCSGGSMEGRILVSELPQNGVGFNQWELSKAEGARIVAVMPGNAGNAKNLTEEFYSAMSPALSYDGEKILFAGKKEATDNWQIWEMQLSTGKATQITNEEADCLSPSYLPLHRLGFTRQVSSEKVSSCNMVFTANLDGSNVQQVTFSPQTFAALGILKDGRFLAMEKQVYPTEGSQKLMVLRPDGTKLEFFYKSEEGKQVLSKAVETDQEEILFVESGETGSEIVSISYNIPLHSHKILTEGISGDFYSVANYLNGNLLGTFRKTAQDNFALFEFDPSSSAINELYKSNGYHVMEALLVKPYQRPRNLPSEVQLLEKAGLLMCQDINFYGMQSITYDQLIPAAEKIEVLGIDSTLGVVDVEEDGSFYLKVEADVPFRIQTLSADNEIISGPGSWYYIRPNERRACVGCHTGPEITPFNRQPLSVRKDPVIIKNNSEVKLQSNMKDYEH